MTTDPRRSLARVLYLLPQRGVRVGDKEFDAAWEWLLEEERSGRSTADSNIGKVAARVDAVLRWIDAAGLELKPKG